MKKRLIESYIFYRFTPYIVWFLSNYLKVSDTAYAVSLSSGSGLWCPYAVSPFLSGLLLVCYHIMQSMISYGFKYGVIQCQYLLYYIYKYFVTIYGLIYYYYYNICYDNII